MKYALLAAAGFILICPAAQAQDERYDHFTHPYPGYEDYLRHEGEEARRTPPEDQERRNSEWDRRDRYLGGRAEEWDRSGRGGPSPYEEECSRYGCR
jgi:hypothetical protein